MSSKTTWWYKLKYKFTKWLWRKENTAAWNHIEQVDWDGELDQIVYPPHRCLENPQ